MADDEGSNASLQSVSDKLYEVHGDVREIKTEVGHMVLKVAEHDVTIKRIDQELKPLVVEQAERAARQANRRGYLEFGVITTFGAVVATYVFTHLATIARAFTGH